MEPTAQQPTTTPSNDYMNSEPVTAPSTLPPPPKKRSVLKIILIILGVLVLLTILAIAAGFYFLQSQGLTLDKLDPNTPQPTSSVSKTTGTTSTYKNNAYKFEVEIPKDYDIKEDPHGFGVTSIEMREPETAEDEEADIQMLVFPKAMGAAIGQDFDKYYGLADNTTQEIKDPTGGTVVFTKVKNRTINNLRAFEFKSGAAPITPDLELENGVYIELGNDVMVMTTGESNKAKLEKVLTDFKYPQ